MWWLTTSQEEPLRAQSLSWLIGLNVLEQVEVFTEWIEGRVKASSGQTQALTADLWGVAAVSIDAVPGSKSFPPVAAVGRSPQLRVCVCVWLYVCLFVCLSVCLSVLSLSHLLSHAVILPAGERCRWPNRHESVPRPFSSLQKVTYFFHWNQNTEIFLWRKWSKLFFVKPHWKVCRSRIAGNNTTNQKVSKHRDAKTFKCRELSLNSCSDFYFVFLSKSHFHKFRLNWSGTFLEVQLWASESFILKEKLEKFNVWSRGNNTKHCSGAGVSGVSWKCFTFCSGNMSPLNLQTPSAALQQDPKLLPTSTFKSRSLVGNLRWSR